MQTRDRQPEWMDQPDLPADMHQQALAGLSRLNRVSGVAGATYRQIRKYALAAANGDRNRPLRVLDVASGAGDVPIAWVKKATAEKIRLHVTMVDVSPTAIDEQRRRCKIADVTLDSIQMDCLTGKLPGGFDVVTCSLFMHHLDDHQATKLLQTMQSATENAILVCDLDRSRLNLGLVTLGSRLLSRSPIVHNDAVLSVRGAYTADEFGRLAQSALSRPVRLRRTFPCRFLMTLDDRAATQSAVAFA